MKKNFKPNKTEKSMTNCQMNYYKKIKKARRDKSKNREA